MEGLRYLNTFSNLIFNFFFLLLLYTTHINTHYVLLLMLTVPMYTMLSRISNIPYLVANVDCTLTGSATLPFRTSNISQENTAADILIEDQLWPPLDMVKLTWSKNCTNQPNS